MRSTWRGAVRWRSDDTPICSFRADEEEQVEVGEEERRPTFEATSEFGLGLGEVALSSLLSLLDRPIQAAHSPLSGHHSSFAVRLPARYRRDLIERPAESEKLAVLQLPSEFYVLRGQQFEEVLVWTLTVITKQGAPSLDLDLALAAVQPSPKARRLL